MWTHLLCRSAFFDVPALLPIWMQISTSYLGRPATLHLDTYMSLVSYLFNSQLCIHKHIHSTYTLTHFQTHTNSHSTVVHQWLVCSRLTCLWLLPRIPLSFLYCPLAIVHLFRHVPIVLPIRIDSYQPVYKLACILQSSLKLDLVFNTKHLDSFTSLACLFPSLPSVKFYSVRTLLHLYLPPVHLHACCTFKGSWCWDLTSEIWQ